MGYKHGHEKSNRRGIAKKISRYSAWSKSQAQIERIKFNTKQNKNKLRSNQTEAKPKKRDDSLFPNHELRRKEDGSYMSEAYRFDVSRWSHLS